jgi:hypothetical protein
MGTRPDRGRSTRWQGRIPGVGFAVDITVAVERRLFFAMTCNTVQKVKQNDSPLEELAEAHCGLLDSISPQYAKF